MIEMVIQVDAPPGAEHAVKEALAMYLEYFGDTRVISIKEIQPEQMQMGLNLRAGQQQRKGRK